MNTSAGDASSSKSRESSKDDNIRRFCFAFLVSIQNLVDDIANQLKKFRTSSTKDERINGVVSVMNQLFINFVQNMTVFKTMQNQTYVFVCDRQNISKIIHISIELFHKWMRLIRCVE